MDDRQTRIAMLEQEIAVMVASVCIDVGRM